MNIRILKPEDATLFRAARRQALVEFPSAFAQTEAEWLSLPHETIAERLTDQFDPVRKFTLGAFIGEDLVGMIGFLQISRLKMRHKGFIWGVYVRPDCHGQGIGGQLLDATLTACRQIADLRLVHLSVATQNRTAVALYESRGFQTYGTEAESLRLGDTFIDQYQMVLFL